MDLETAFEALGLPLPPFVVVAAASDELMARVFCGVCVVESEAWEFEICGDGELVILLWRAFCLGFDLYRA